MDVDTSLETGQQIAVVGAVLTAVGAFLPWVSAGIVTVTGIDGDGIFTLGFAILVGAVVFLRPWDRLSKIAVGVLGVLSVSIAGLVYTNLGQTVAGQVTVTLNAGGGLHLTMLGSLVMLAGALLGYRE